MIDMPENQIKPNHITVYTLFVLDRNSWYHIIVGKLFVLDRNTRYHINVCKKLLRYIKNININEQWTKLRNFYTKYMVWKQDME